MVGVPDNYLQIVREGMRLAVTSNRKDATVKFFNIPGIKLAAKTGTAQLGYRNESMNSWSVGFWPSDNPHYAYAVVLEGACGHALGSRTRHVAFFSVANRQSSGIYSISIVYRVCSIGYIQDTRFKIHVRGACYCEPRGYNASRTDKTYMNPVRNSGHAQSGFVE